MSVELIGTSPSTNHVNYICNFQKATDRFSKSERHPLHRMTMSYHGELKLTLVTVMFQSTIFSFTYL